MSDKSNSNGKDNTLSDLLDTLMIILAMDTIGQIVITRNAMSVLDRKEITKALKRHLRGDWGDTDPEDAKMNDWALRNGGRVMSVYHTSEGVKFWIITEDDRSFTTILLPEDY